MPHTIRRRFISGVAAVLAMALPLFANFLLDDLEHGGNRNNLGQYWYTFASPLAHAGILQNGGTTFVPVTDGYNGSTYGAAMNFAGLTASAAATAYASIGMGTRLAETDAVGIGSSFASVTAIEFWAKGPGGLIFNFNVETIENTSANSNAYTAVRTILPANANQWRQYIINISPITSPTTIGPITGESTFGGRAGDLAQEPYHGTSFTFNPANVTKISWALKSDPNNKAGAPGNGSFVVDDISLIGFTPPTPPDVCETCVSNTFTPPAPNALFSDFEGAGALAFRNELEYFWYRYSDSPSGGTSVASALIADSAGRTGGATASITYVMGSPFPSGANTVDPFVGIGTNLYDEAAGTQNYLNTSNFSGIYFEYKTVGAEFIKVELHDGISMAGTHSGADPYIRLQGTNGQWRAAVIPFTTFRLPSWAAREPLNSANLAKIQIAHYGTGSGSIVIDNVYFIGDNKFDKPPIVPPTTTYTLTYSSNNMAWGGISVNGGADVSSYNVTLDSGTTGPTVVARPALNYVFSQWSDNVTTAARTDIATRDLAVTAIFAAEQILVDTFSITYTAADGGTLSVLLPAGVPSIHPQYVIRGPTGYDAGATITAVPESGNLFVRWSDNNTAAARSDIVGTGNVAVTAIFAAEQIPVDTFSITYTAIDGGTLSVLLPTGVPSTHTQYVIRGPTGYDAGVTITAVPDSGNLFVRWSDNNTAAARSDIVGTGNLEYTAVFALDNTDASQLAFSYKAEEGGTIGVAPTDFAMQDAIVVGDSTAQVYEGTVLRGYSLPAITAHPNQDFIFVRWSDGDTTNPRTDTNVSYNINVTATFQPVLSVLGSDRGVPPQEQGWVAPVNITAGELTAGPIPASYADGAINFFLTGRKIQNGQLTVYDAQGNFVNRIRISDNSARSSPNRVVGAWNMKDRKGRTVPEGTYSVRGVLTTSDGSKERVSLFIYVSR